MNNIVKKFKKSNRIQQNRSSGIRKMQTASGGPIGLIKRLAHKINKYGNTEYHVPKVPGTTLSYFISDEIKAHPELTYQQAYENISKRIGSKKTTPSQASAGMAVLGGAFSPWFAAPDIIFDVAATIDEPSNSNIIHTVADFPEVIAKFTPNKIDDYVAKGVQTIGNVDDYLSSKGKNLFEIFDKSHGIINNTTDKTSVRESTNVSYRKQGGMLQLLKKGSGIHIKKKNRGKFTEYCGGTVTDACIRRAKSSGNPTLVKRATFAANARKWKHQEGGTIINQSPIYSAWLYNMLNRDNIAFQNKQLELYKKQLELQETQQQNNFISSIMGTAANGLLSLLNKKQATSV